MAQQDRCLIVIKAQPHRSSRYSETVCCAGIGIDGKWRRQYPVPFRILDPSQKFKRWSWIEYEFEAPEHDRRWESQKVNPQSIVLHGMIKREERSRILCPLIREDFASADSNGDSLTLLRPLAMTFFWEKKSSGELTAERAKHAKLANQLSLFDKTARPLDPPPYKWRPPETPWRLGSGHDSVHLKRSRAGQA